jgi:hypothetical protein
MLMELFAIAFVCLRHEAEMVLNASSDRSSYGMDPLPYSRRAFDAPFFWLLLPMMPGHLKWLIVAAKQTQSRASFEPNLHSSLECVRLLMRLWDKPGRGVTMADEAVSG